MTLPTLTPMESSNGMPARRSTSIRCEWVPMPAPRLGRSTALRSNTTASQPTLRSRCAAISPPSEPPMIRARRWGIFPLLPSPACGGGERAKLAGRGHVRACVLGGRPLSISPPQAGERAYHGERFARLRSSQRPGNLVVAGLVVAVALGRVAVEQRTAEHRMGLGAHRVLEGEQDLAGVEIDDVVEAVLVGVELARDQAEVDQLFVRAREVGDVDLGMMAVVAHRRRVGLAEVIILLVADRDLGLRPVVICNHLGGRPHDVAVETGETRRTAGPHGE